LPMRGLRAAGILAGWRSVLSWLWRQPVT